MNLTIPVALMVFLAGLGIADTRAEPTREIEHQGIKRHALIVNAGDEKQAARPLLVILHGRRDANEANRTSPDLDALAAREGFVLAYPAAINGKWNYVGEAKGHSTVGGVIADDLGFLTKLIDGLEAAKLADPKRIYVSGASQGGFMAYSLICALPNKFAAAAALIASMTEAQITLCKPARPVPLMVIAGTNDNNVRYDGWLTLDDRLTSVPETLEFWRRQHGCTGQKATMLPKQATNPDDRSRTLLVEWSGCKSEGGLRLYRVQGGGHNLPSTKPQPEEERKRFGLRNGDFETSEEVWRFFKPWTLP